ncbi:hypothetical protein DV736_g2027, partial [Chaetothyriales sp. CBS 134916]
MAGAQENIAGDAIAARTSIVYDDNKAFAAQPPTGSIRNSISSQVQKLNRLRRSSSSARQFIAPTEEEKHSLRRVAGSIPLISFSLCLVEFAERASYYGAKTVYTNFIQRPLPEGGNGAGAPPRHTQKTAGALGMGLQAASGLTLLFTFLAYLIPIFGGWLADVKTGRFKAVIYGVIICGVAHIIQVVGAIPSVLQRGAGNAAPPFIIGLLLLAVGAGIFKPNVPPLVLDQNRHQEAWVKTLKSGERVIVDPEATTTRVMLLFYGFVNIGAFFMLATSYSEKYVGFWLSFLEVAVIYLLLPVLLALIYSRLYKAPPAGSSELAHAFRIIGMALRRNKFQIWKKNFWDAAKPSVLAQSGIHVDWNDELVSDVQRTLVATEIFFYFPIWNLNDGGIGSVATNQGASMTTNGAPNDLLTNFNPITIIVAVPILSYVVYPGLARAGIKFGRISRISFGFFLAMISGIIGAIIQWRVYKTSPCGYYASNCDIGTGVSPIRIWWQVPNTVLGALSECFCNVTAYELAYARSPPSMRGLVVAVFLFNTALSSAIGEIMIPATKDPWLIWIWAAPAVALGVQSVLFWWKFHHLNNDEFMTERVKEESGVAESVRNPSLQGYDEETGTNLELEKKSEKQ